MSVQNTGGLEPTFEALGTPPTRIAQAPMSPSRRTDLNVVSEGPRLLTATVGRRCDVHLNRIVQINRPVFTAEVRPVFDVHVTGGQALAIPAATAGRTRLGVDPSVPARVALLQLDEAFADLCPRRA